MADRTKQRKWEQSAAGKEYRRRYRLEHSEEFKRWKREYYERNKALVRERALAWIAANPERNREIKNSSARRRYVENPEVRNSSTKRWVRANRDKVRAMNNALTEKLSDCYVRLTLARKTKLPREKIPQSLVEVQRLILQIKRSIRNGQA